eukprot:scaffold675123_cov57-Prasinocladus_malaysianus.AAC.1
MGQGRNRASNQAGGSVWQGEVEESSRGRGRGLQAPHSRGSEGQMEELGAIRSSLKCTWGL